MTYPNFLDHFEYGFERTFMWKEPASPAWERTVRPFRLTFSPLPVGSLHLKSGRLVASDPFVYFDEAPFVRTLSPGSYDVILSIADIERGYPRVAFAMLKVSEKEVMTWELAKRELSESRRGGGQLTPYSVDSGTGCFMDSTTQLKFNHLYLEAADRGQDIVGDMDWIGESTVQYLNYQFPNSPTNNLIAFSSGWGDGGYLTYAGLDEDGDTACFVTDFEVAKDTPEK